MYKGINPLEYLIFRLINLQAWLCVHSVHNIGANMRGLSEESCDQIICLQYAICVHLLHKGTEITSIACGLLILLSVERYPILEQEFGLLLQSWRIICVA